MNLTVAYYALVAASVLTAVLFVIDYFIQKSIGDTSDNHDDLFREIELITQQTLRIRDERIEICRRFFQLAMADNILPPSDLKLMAWELNRYRQSDALRNPLQPVDGVLSLSQPKLAEHFKELSIEFGNQSKVVQKELYAAMSRQVALAQREKRLSHLRSFLIIFLQISILAFVVIDKLPRSATGD